MNTKQENLTEQLAVIWITEVSKDSTAREINTQEAFVTEVLSYNDDNAYTYVSTFSKNDFIKLAKEAWKNLKTKRSEFKNALENARYEYQHKKHILTEQYSFLGDYIETVINVLEE